MRNSMVFYRSFWEAAKLLPDEERLKVFDAIMTYGLDGIDLDVEGVAKAIYLMVKPQIDANNRKYQNGCKGGRPKTKAKPNDNVNENDNVKENDNVNENDNFTEDPVSFISPTVDEVESYCRKEGLSIDAEGFIDYYQSNGWLVGKNPMKDWKAAARNWSRNKRDVVIRNTPENAQGHSSKKNAFHNFDQRSNNYLNVEQDAINRIAGRNRKNHSDCEV